MRGGQNKGFPQGGSGSYKRLSGCEVTIFLDFLIATFIRYHYPGRERLQCSIKIEEPTDEHVDAY
jgi:hypothetical protein